MRKLVLLVLMLMVVSFQSYADNKVNLGYHRQNTTLHYKYGKTENVSNHTHFTFFVKHEIDFPVPVVKDLFLVITNELAETVFEDMEKLYTIDNNYYYTDYTLTVELEYYLPFFNFGTFHESR